MRSETRIRDEAVQSCPELKYPPILIASATVAGSASSSTTIGALPPSSRWTRLTVSAAFFAISFPVAVSPGERDEADRRVAHEAVARRHAVPGHDLEHPLRQDLLRELDEAQRR